MTTKITIALVETMPDCHRESHREARNWGTFPANGAERHWRCLNDAACIVADDPDEYDNIVRRDEIELGDCLLRALRDAAADSGRCRGPLHQTDLCAYSEAVDDYVLTERGWALADSLVEYAEDTNTFNRC